jgi:hypothetical protein
METLYRLACNEGGCEARGPADALMSEARNLAWSDGWDVGPHHTESRLAGRLTHHTDYCPAHDKRKGPQ